MLCFQRTHRAGPCLPASARQEESRTHSLPWPLRSHVSTSACRTYKASRSLAVRGRECHSASSTLKHRKAHELNGCWLSPSTLPRNFPKMTREVAGPRLRPGCLAPESQLCTFRCLSSPRAHAGAAGPHGLSSPRSSFGRSAAGPVSVWDKGPLEPDSESFWVWNGWSLAAMYQLAIDPAGLHDKPPQNSAM